MEEKLFDPEELTEEIREMLDEFHGEFLDSAGDLIDNSVRDAVGSVLEDFTFVLPDGTQVVPRKKMRLTSPDRTKVLMCYGGLRVQTVTDTAGWWLVVQTRADSWEQLCAYPTKEQAIEALEKVGRALDENRDSFAL